LQLASIRVRKAALASMIAADRPFCSGKNRRHGMNLQVIASRMDTEPLLCRTRRPSTAFRVVEGSFGWTALTICAVAVPLPG
jgi:hypothetical protein